MQTDAKIVHATWREVTGKPERSTPADTEMMDEAGDVLTWMVSSYGFRVRY
ncbi:hypothetical protein ACQSED_19420 [Salmonella enterica]|uniref:hypothetical protein n=1 Tax=Salmonella enterica TaxID=28901 RepID=UPI001D392C72|nr:hypothetical protein [Salmonella enterica subsp. diarizonae]EDW1844771.1 hypothetical protein [Salmonella enterica subsp. enterica]HDC2545763.1 hypothetical protein [Salmonella enterica]HDC2560742.1 hypothetical protein [Salmonella enterica]